MIFLNTKCSFDILIEWMEVNTIAADLIDWRIVHGLSLLFCWRQSGTAEQASIGEAGSAAVSLSPDDISNFKIQSGEAFRILFDLTSRIRRG